MCAPCVKGLHRPSSLPSSRSKPINGFLLAYLTFPRKDLVKTCILHSNSDTKYLNSAISSTDNSDNVYKKRKAISCHSCLIHVP